MTITSVQQSLTVQRRTRAAQRGTTAAAAVYVGAWLLGLALAPSSPAPNAPAAGVAVHYADNAAGVLTSSALVHGAAGIALTAFGWFLAAAVEARGGLRRAVVGTALAAGVLSLTQVVLAASAVAYAEADAAGTADLFQALNLVDVLKIALLASFVLVATTAVARAQGMPRWLCALATALVPTLVVGSAALVEPAAPLSVALAASLIGLLVWTGAVAVVLRGVSH